jgi:very-short-patch-repair endonuclease
MTLLTESLARVVTEMGWQPGTHLENHVARRLTMCGLRAEQQYTVGHRYHLDFAWPEMKIGLEADGWIHRDPEKAASDRRRDSWLRNEGWLIFRVDDEFGEDSIRGQVTRVAVVVRKLTTADDAGKYITGRL